MSVGGNNNTKSKERRMETRDQLELCEARTMWKEGRFKTSKRKTK